MDQIRKIKEHDLGQLLALYHQLHHDEDTAITPERKAAFTEILQNKNSYLLVTERDGKIIATVHLTIMPNLSRNGSPAAYIENVIVDQNLHGQKVGETIMNHAIEIAKARHCYKVFLCTGSITHDDTPELMERRHRFYAKSGLKLGIKNVLVRYLNRE